jgi:hypothetical protein
MKVVLQEECNMHGMPEKCVKKIVGNKRKRPLRRRGRRWEDNIKMNLRQTGRDYEDWINLAKDRDQWRALVETIMKFRIA